MRQLIQTNQVHTTAVSFLFTPAVGHTVIVGVCLWDNAIGSTSISDNQGNTYTQAVNRSPGSVSANVAIFTAPILVASGTFTISYTGTGNPTLFILEYGGLLNESLVDQSNTHDDSGSTSPTSGSINSPNANQLILALTSNDVSSDGVITFTPAAGYAKVMEDRNGSSSQAGCLIEEISASGSYNAGWTLNQSQNCISVIVSLNTIPSVYRKYSRPRPFSPGVAR